MTLKPHALIFRPETRSRLFAIYRPELLIEIDESTSQDVADSIVPAECPKTPSDPKIPSF